MVQVHLNQISDHIKTHAIWAKKLILQSIWTQPSDSDAIKIFKAPF